MAHAKLRTQRSDMGAPPLGQQPVLGAATASFAPVPNLAELEQTGGPEFDGKLELPTRVHWSSRFSPDLFED